MSIISFHLGPGEKQTAKRPEQRGKDEGKHHSRDHARGDTQQQRGERGGIGVGIDPAVDIEQERVERGDEECGQHCDEHRLRRRHGKAMPLGIQSDEKSAQPGGQDPKKGRDGKAVSDHLIEKAADKPDGKPVDRSEQRRADQDRQGIERDLHARQIDRKQA